MQIFEFQPDERAWSTLMQEMQEAMEERQPVFLAVDDGAPKLSVGENGTWTAALAEAKRRRRPHSIRRTV